MNILKKTVSAIAFCLTSAFSFAQAPVSTAAASTDFMKSNGKIYVVVAVVLVILIGLFAYLINLDRKVSRLEKENPNSKNQ